MSDAVDPAAGGTPAPTPGPRAARARELVVAALEECDGAIASWEGGSAAFGRADDQSDLDVGVLCIRGAATHVLNSIERGLREAGEPLDSWDVGRSAFGTQRFWQPTGHGAQSVLCMVDASVIEHERERDEWRELLLPERHGRALALHDPDGVLARARAAASFDAEAHRGRLATELERIRDRRRMFGGFVEKELGRGRVLDAAGMHHSTVVVPLVALLGMRHRPLRWDFGLRYLHDELPAAAAARLTPIVQPGVDGLGDAAVHGLAWIDELLDGLDPVALPIEQHAESMRAAYA
jgi:predicted nucleotidyltransferase